MEVEKIEVEQGRGGFLMTTIDFILNQGRTRSFWPLTTGLACCAIEVMATGGARFDLARFGYEVFRASPRHSDLLLVSGTLTYKMAPLLVRLYEQMPAPKWVIAVGNCACTGGPFIDSYNVVKGVDKVLPVDVYLPGCPPRPEALLDSLIKLKAKVLNPKVVNG